MQRRLNSEASVYKPLKMFHVRGVFTIFFREQVSIFVTFFKRIFSGRVNFKQLKCKNEFRGVRGHAPPEIFEILHTAMAILVLFE